MARLKARFDGSVLLASETNPISSPFLLFISLLCVRTRYFVSGKVCRMGWPGDSLVVLDVGRWRKLWEDDRREGVNGERMVSGSVMNGCAI